MSAVETALPHDITADLPPAPFPGLRPFNPYEWAIFFGRETMIDEVIRLLAGQHLVVIHGASGCGKSSLVRAGVLPWLELDHAASGVPWKTAIARPAGGPLRNLAAEFAKALGPAPNAEGDPTAAWHDRLALGGIALPDIQAALESTDTSLCLLIDQFEELFRWGRDNPEEAQLATALLRRIAEGEAPRLFVILAMRSDYLGACASFEGFAETVNTCQYLLPRMDNFALLRAIHEPAQLYGGTVAPAVGDRLLFETRREQDPLPVLQHTLMRACGRALARHGPGDGWTVTAEDVAAVGGAAGALAGHAEEVLATVTAGDQKRLRAAEWVFRTITDLDAEGRLVRRPRRLGELVDVAGDREGVLAVVEAFRASGCSFLTSQPAGDLTDASEIDVSHEALIRRWPRLASEARDRERALPEGWVWREFEDGLRWRGLAVQAEAFTRNPQATLSPATTEAYESWWPEHGPAWAVRYAREPKEAREEYASVERLWHASERTLGVERERLRLEQRLRHRAQRLAFASGMLLLLCFVALAGMVWFSWTAETLKSDALEAKNLAVENERAALFEKTRAQAAEKLALVAKNQALVNESRLLAKITDMTIKRDGPVIAALLALKGLPETFSPPDRPMVAEAAGALESAIVEIPISTTVRHDRPVSSAVFSADGKRFLTASDDNTARIWDSATGSLLRVLHGHSDEVWAAEFSRDGSHVVTASRDRTARVWDATSGQTMHVLTGHSDAVRSAKFSSSGRHIVTVSRDGTARTWDAATGTPLLTLGGDDVEIHSAMFSTDGEQIVTTASKRCPQIWELASGQVLRELCGHDGIVYSAAFSPSGKLLVTASDDNTARIWDTGSGRELFILRGHRDTVMRAEFSHDGARILTFSSDRTARIWDANSGREVAQPLRHDEPIGTAKISPDGNRILTTSLNSALIWDAASGEQLRAMRGHEKLIHSAVFSTDGSSVLTASADNTAQIWDAAPGHKIPALHGHKKAVLAASFSPDGACIITASEDNTARVWSTDSTKELAVLGSHTAPVISATYSNDGTHVLTASLDNTAQIWDAGSYKLLHVLRGHERELFSSAFSADGSKVVTASRDFTSRIWSTASGLQLKLLQGHQNWIRTATFSHDGARVVTASDDSTARVWDTISGAELVILRGHTLGLLSAVFSADGTRVLTASWDNTARIWDAGSGQELYRLVGHDQPVYTAVFSPNSALVVTASDDDTARIWDANSGDLLHILRGHEHEVESAVFSSDGTRVLTASEDGTARIWDTASGRLIRVLDNHGEPVMSAAFSKDGRRIVTASSGETAQIWQTWPGVEELVEEARRRVTWQLTPQQEERYGLPHRDELTTER